MRLESLVAIRMREAREEAELSQEALGVLAGIDEATAKVRINQYENGKHSPPLSMLDKIASVLGKPAIWFICENDIKELVLLINEVPAENRLEAIGQLVIELKNRTT
ncbi:helix-turn-helix domain-containing protein [Methylophilus sp. 'Pure River']|uniref:helix-turn-helix domain-containing protein n=1 Tax=Methylophilus sp. 'Pure River' TaxID=3377117 RepID=UPI00398EE692